MAGAGGGIAEQGEAARRYAGHPFWLQAHLVGESAEEDSDLVGWKVEDADGKPVGVILSAVEMGEYILLTIDHQGRGDPVAPAR